MRSDGWHLAEDLDQLLARAGDFLRSRPVPHTTVLTATEALRTRGPGAHGAGAPLLGHLERSGEVRAVLCRRPPGPLNLTPLSPEEADALAARLAALGHTVPGVRAEHGTATAFADAWRRHTGATPSPRGERTRLYRLGTPVPPDPPPAGRGRTADARDHGQLMLWCREFAAAVGETFPADARSWPETPFATRDFTFWETPDGTPAAMAGVTPMVAGQVRVAPVYTPPHLRGRGYAGAVTVEVCRAALAAGATDVVLFADVTNPTSNALYRRIGFLPVTEFTAYDLGHAAPRTA
ncbi:GNAT family N-acetyltransferase [Streptomyces sp. NPDC012751]|uniref:GNAT family N-acetyltransferase n=1 Tax=Streptomyces sp. NPDC012751 TaxID=3364846 RepID=UPI0036CAEB1F